MNQYIDLHVHDGDFVFDEALQAQTVSDRQSIGQDIKHRLIESGLVLMLLGQRSEEERQAIINKVLIEVDKDSRLEPGTAQLLPSSPNHERYVLTATTIDYGQLQVDFQWPIAASDTRQLIEIQKQEVLR